MKYFTLAAITLAGVAFAAPAPKPESEVWQDMTIDYDGLNEDCYDDETDSFQPAAVHDDIIIDDIVNDDAECDDGPIEEIDLEDIIIKPQYDNEDLVINVEPNPVFNGTPEAYDEDCVDETFETTTEAKQIVKEDTTEYYGGDCYDENGDDFNEEDNYQVINADDIENADIIGEADTAFGDIDLMINKNEPISDNGEAEGYEACLEY
jgi:hypothetical protein